MSFLRGHSRCWWKWRINTRNYHIEFDTMFVKLEKFKQLVIDIDPNTEWNMQNQWNLEKELQLQLDVCREK